MSGISQGHGIPYLLSRVARIQQRQKSVIPCRMGRELIAVAPDGSLYPCHWLVGHDEFRVGSVEGGIDRARLTGSYPASVRTKRSCLQCWARYLCDGACPAVSLLEFGHDQLVNRWLCLDRNLAWKWTLWLYVALLNRKFSWFMRDPMATSRSADDA